MSIQSGGMPGQHVYWADINPECLGNVRWANVKRRRWIAVAALIMLIVAVYLLAWPVPIDPAAWSPPTPPQRTGVLSPNSRLAGIERLARGFGIGPEDIAVDSDGRLYSGYVDGRIVRLQPDGRAPEVFANTGGRPLGLDFDAAGNLIVADADKGLLSISTDGAIHVLATEEGGVRFGFTDDVCVADDGTVYFTDASYKFGRYQYMEDILEHRGNGRLLAYYPQDKRVVCLMRDLYFANGVAVSPDGTFVVVNETGKYRVMRYWLKGEQQGQSEVFAENLPGFPDNVSCNGRDSFWVALFAPRNPTLDATLPHPGLRKVVYRLPAFARPKAAHHAQVLELGLDGQIKRLLEDDSPACYAPITSVEERDGMLYLGSLEADSLGRIQLAEPAAAGK